MTAHRIAYRRVSTTSQSTDRQLDGETFDQDYTDKISGAKRDRPQLDAMLGAIRPGDEVHVHSIDRLARSLADLLTIVETITGKGASVRFHKEGMHFTGEDSPMQRLYLEVLGAVAAFERNMIVERAAEGRAAAKARGVKFGRKSTITDKQVRTILDERAAGKPVTRIAIDLDLSRATVHRIIAKAKVAA